MDVRQLIYTSCRMGESGSAGFQFRSSSAGVTQEEKRELESFIGYSAPVRPIGEEEPSVEEIQGSFPRALRYARLKSNRWSLSLSCYVGQDYTGRGGNFFAHALLGEGRLPRWPIDYYNWEGWQSWLRPEDDTHERPAPLPAVDLDGIEPSTSFTLPLLRDFVQEQDDRASLLEAMVRVVATGAVEARKMVIRADFLDGLYWIACLQKLLPVALMEKVTFSTYQFDERRCADVNLTVEGCRFTFDEVNRERRFHMFDMLNGVHSAVAPARNDYAAKVTGWLLKDPERLLGGFHAFAQDFDLTTADSLLHAARLFEASERLGPLPVGAELSSLLEFASRSTSAEGYDRVLEVVAGLALHARASGNVEDHERLVGFFADAAHATRKPEHRAHAWQAWADMLTDLADARADVFARVVSARQRLETRLGQWANEFADFLLSNESQAELQDRLGPKGPDAWQRVLGEVVFQLRASRRLPLTAQPQAAWWIAKLLRASGEPGAVRALVKAFEPDAHGAAEVALYAASTFHQYREDGRGLDQFCLEYGRHLAPLLASLGPADATAARQRLDVPAGHPVLLGEWEAWCARAQRPDETLREYERSVLPHLPAFARHMHPQIIGAYERVLSPAQRIEFAWNSLQQGELGRTPPDVQQRLLSAINDSLIFRPGATPLLRSVGEAQALAERARIPLTPDRLSLWQVVDVINNPEDPRPLTEAIHFPTVAGLAARLPPEEQSHFLAHALAGALLRLRSPEVHRTMLTSFARSGLESALVRAYRDVVQNGHLRPVHLTAMTGFWIDREGGVAALRLPENVAAEMEQLFVAQLVKLEARDYHNVRESLRASLPRAQAERLLAGLDAAVEQKRKGLFGFVGGFFNRSPKG